MLMGSELLVTLLKLSTTYNAAQCLLYVRQTLTLFVKIPF